MKRKHPGLKAFVFFLIFIILFSTIGIIVTYLKGINAREEAKQKALQEQEQQENDNTLINIPKIETKILPHDATTGNNLSGTQITIGDNDSKDLEKEVESKEQ